MAFDKAKVLKAAEKFLAQGKIAAAIKEYRQIVEHDEDDFTTLNMLGDLSARAGDKDEAIFCFRRIAEHYHAREFTLKAIAMYRKIEKLKPRDPEIANKLGELYDEQGLNVDARAQYLVVADAYTRAGQTKQALDVLHKIADLDPHNTAVRLKLAAGYLQEGLGSEAAQAFVEAGRRLLEVGSLETSLESFNHALEIRPHDQEALKGIVSVHIALGTADEAAEVLERALKDGEDDPRLISMLAEAYLEAEDAPGAERVVAMLLKEDPANYTRLIDVARLYVKLGNIDEAARVLVGITEQMLAGREENDLLELVNELLERDPEHVTALRLLVRIHWWQRDMEKLRATLERLAEAAEAAELPEEERYALTQLVRLVPDEARYAVRLAELGGVQEDIAEEPIMRQDPALSPPPAFENFAIVANEAAETPAPEGQSENGEFEFNAVTTEPVVFDDSASFADLNENPASDNGSNFGDEIPAPEFEFSGAGTLPAAEGELSAGADQTRREATMLKELESVDFYLTQGYTDIALDTLEMLERQFGSNAEIEARRRKLDTARETPAETATEFDLGGQEQTAAFDEPQASAPLHTGIIAQEVTSEAPAADLKTKPPTKPALDAGLVEIFEEFRVAAEEEHEPVTEEDYETHYNMGIAYKEMDLLDEAIQEFQIAATLVGAGDGTARYFQCCNMLGHSFLQKGIPRAATGWFKKGLAAPGRSEDEYMALRYELGAAYEQMGDHDKALDMFTEVYGVDVSYRDVADKVKSLEVSKR